MNFEMMVFSIIIGGIILSLIAALLYAVYLESHNTDKPYILDQTSYEKDDTKMAKDTDISNSSNCDNNSNLKTV